MSERVDVVAGPGRTVEQRTREVRWRDGDDLVVETTWTQGAAQVTRQVRYRRVQP